MSGWSSDTSVYCTAAITFKGASNRTLNIKNAKQDISDAVAGDLSAFHGVMGATLTQKVVHDKANRITYTYTE